MYKSSRYFLIILVICVIVAFPQTPLVAKTVAAPETIGTRSTLGGPLTIHPTNPRYFSNGFGELVYLTGSHHWNNLQDSTAIYDTPFDYDAYLDFLQKYNHNFIRMWVWEQARWVTWSTGNHDFDPVIYERTGPGTAQDGKPKFDLTQFNQDYFDRLRARVVQAGERGIYVSVMFFQGFSVETKGYVGNPWRGHPFHRDNNINGIDGDPNGDGEGSEVHTLQISAVTELQEAYVRQVVDTLNDLDNVLWEISNESHVNSTDWQYHMINYLRAYEATKPKQHLIGMTFQHPNGNNDSLFNSPADWISPGDLGEEPYQTNPPAADGSKVIIVDTDHLWGIGGNRQWVWKSFLRGLHPIYMDTYGSPSYPPADESVRQNMGYTLAYADKVDLVTMVPRGDLASTNYCLANPAANGAEYLVYLPWGGTVTVDLSASPGVLTVEWFNPSTGVTTDGGKVAGGADRSFTAPFSGDAVLYIWDSPILYGRPGDQTIYLNWTVNDTLPVTSTWQIDYTSETGTVLLPPISIPTSTVRSYTLTDLTNYVWYTVTLNAMVSATPIITCTARVMPTDIFAYLPLVLRSFEHLGTLRYKRQDYDTKVDPFFTR